MGFEWDEEKRLSNLEKHSLDFSSADLIFDGRPRRTWLSDFVAERRYLTTALVNGRLVTMVWTERGDRIRVISLRRARDAEEREYRALHG